MKRWRERLACAALLLASSWPATGVAEPALWAVAGRSNTVYLFGSVHLLRAGDFQFEGALADAWNEAEVLYLEVDLDALSPLEVAATTAARAMDPEGRTLSELLGPDADLAHERARQAGIDLTPLGQFEPWFASLAVTVLALAGHGYSPDAGIERMLQARAAADGKQLYGLETLDEQLGLLDAMDPAAQRALLLKSLTDAERAGAVAARLVAAWRDGDTDFLAGELADEFTDAPQLYRSLIVERNERWAAHIEALLDEQRDYLVVVGALHLAGPDGLPRLLEVRGARVGRR